MTLPDKTEPAGDEGGCSPLGKLTEVGKQAPEMVTWIVSETTPFYLLLAPRIIRRPASPVFKTSA